MTFIIDIVSFAKTNNFSCKNSESHQVYFAVQLLYFQQLHNIFSDVRMAAAHSFDFARFFWSTFETLAPDTGKTHGEYILWKMPSGHHPLNMSDTQS